MTFYILTILNLGLSVLAMGVVLNTLVRYNVAKRWANYSLFQFTILVGVVLVQIYSLYEKPSDWQVRLLVSTIITISKLYFAYCLKFSSIRKN